MKQASAWGQFWFDLSEHHGVHRCGIYTPNDPDFVRQPFRKAYYSTWIRNGVYRTVEGDTMYEMIRNGLDEFDVWSLRTKINLLAVLMDDLAYAVSRDR